MITLTPRAEQYLQVLAALDRGALLMSEAADLLGRSVRQVRRLRGAYRVRGAAPPAPRRPPWMTEPGKPPPLRFGTPKMPTGTSWCCGGSRRPTASPSPPTAI